MDIFFYSSLLIKCNLKPAIIVIKKLINSMRYMLDYSAILYRVCLLCKMSTFLCPVCLELRDQTEEYVNGHCIYETKAMKQIFDKLMELETRISALEN